MKYNDFALWVNRELNMDLTAYKENQVERRLERYLIRKKINGFNELTKILRLDLKERKEFLEFITINVTEFFRNPELFYEFKNILIEDKLKLCRPLKVWSAGCSNGCEPYTVSIILKTISPNYKHDILATDIDEAILKKAKKGEYTSADIKNLDDNYINIFFSYINNVYRVNDGVKLLVRFKKHDLIKDIYEEGFDIILCRNVFIYFKDEVKHKLFMRLSNSLKPGGFLFLGATESIYNYRDFGFEKVTTFIYRKV